MARPMETLFEIHWPYLALALLLLWFPRPWLRVGRWRKRRRQQRETMVKFQQDGGATPDDKSVRLGRELRSPRNYVDFLRALAGGLALWEFSFTAGVEDWKFVLGVQLAITFAAILIQSVRWKSSRVTFFAAIFFYAGISIGMGHHVSGLLAFLLVCAVNPVLPTPRLFVSAYAAVLLPFNYFLGGTGLLLSAANALMLLAPVLLSLLAHRPMVIFMRKHEVMW